MQIVVVVVLARVRVNRCKLVVLIRMNRCKVIVLIRMNRCKLVVLIKSKWVQTSCVN